MSKTNVTVEQVDREAAADHLDMMGYDWGVCGDVREGRLEHPVVQAFARHRHTSTLQAQEQIKLLREALERIVAARMAIEGGSIAECRSIARQALEATNG